MKMSTSLLGSLSCMWLLMAMVATAQNTPVLDTTGQPLQRGVEYYIKPAITDNGGRFTLINRNNSCPFYVGQENVSGPEGLPVTFAPFNEEENVVRESSDFKISFSAATICIQSTTWKLGERDEETQRRLILTGNDERFGNYFRIDRQSEGIYFFHWCPTEACPICRFDCTTTSVGALVENGKRLLALDGSVLPVVFERA
ncbi:hypothetical protein UlMin_027319 [Ulmus minor]